MTKPIAPSVTTWTLRVRFKMFVTTGNTGGSFRVGIGNISLTLGSINSANDNAIINLDSYAKNAWHDVELYIKPTSYSSGPTVALLEIIGTDPITGDKVWISDLYVDEVGSTPNIPQKTTSGSTALQIDSQGAHHYISSGGVTIPNNSDVAFPVDTIITVINASDSTQTISKGGSVTLYKGGTTGTQSSLTLAARGEVTLLKVASDTWYAYGNI